MRTCLGHEKREGYPFSFELIISTVPRLSLTSSAPAGSPLDRTFTSIAPDMADGNGKFSAADRCRFFDHAPGSALECISDVRVLGTPPEFATQETNTNTTENTNKTQSVRAAARP